MSKRSCLSTVKLKNPRCTHCPSKAIMRLLEMKLHEIQQKPAEVIISSFREKAVSGWRCVSFQTSVCDTLLHAGPHWQAHVIPVTFPEPSHFIRPVINHCRNNVVAWNAGAAAVQRRRASAAMGLLGTHAGATGKVLPWWPFRQRRGPPSHWDIRWHRGSQL